jgi:hypothetical protein
VVDYVEAVDYAEVVDYLEVVDYVKCSVMWNRSTM